jgi:2-polyprenyl-3-methyl-5-hydroxy-6-metoxy-1,4-benzoquinol methylase
MSAVLRRQFNMADTPERVGTAEDYELSPVWPEHRARYHFAALRARDQIVLDVACGTGYGSYLLLSAGAANVTAVDASPEAVAEASKHGCADLSVIEASITALPLRSDSVDLVISFETVEHIDDDEACISELARVLAPTGTALISTPNALHTKPPQGVPRNPHHVREYVPHEFLALTERYFGAVRLLGQRPAPASRPCPYWEREEVLPQDAVGRARVLAWKVKRRVASRLPRTLRIRFEASLHPNEHQFVFDGLAPEAGHVLVAECRRPFAGKTAKERKAAP